MPTLRSILNSLFVITAVVASSFGNPAVAGPLIAFTDNNPDSATGANLSDTDINWAVSWTQTVSSRSVSMSVLLSSNVGATTGSWYVTNRLGIGATAANVLFSGNYLLGDDPLDAFDFNTSPRTLLGAGLEFGAGTYFLVLDGPASPYYNSATWFGDQADSTTVTLATGYTLGSYWAASSPNGFAPASGFAVSRLAGTPVFELTSADATVAEPTTLALAVLALAAAAGASRRETR
jgi:hypothetical protein